MGVAFKAKQIVQRYLRQKQATVLIACPARQRQRRMTKFSGTKNILTAKLYNAK